RRTRELLLYLLTQNKGATKEQIGAALWPGVDASRVRNNFHVTLHRLRKMLGGAEWISIENETYRIDRKNVDFDVETFVAEARAAAARGGGRSGAAAPLHPDVSGFSKHPVSTPPYLASYEYLQTIKPIRNEMPDPVILAPPAS